MRYAIYRNDTKELVSIALEVPKNFDANVYSYSEVEEYLGTWNIETLSFDPPPPPVRLIPRKEFIERFAPEEWVMLVSLKASDPVVAATFERILMLDYIEPDSTFSQVMAAHFVAQGYLTQERIDEVLS